MKKSYLFKLLVFAVIAAFVTVTSCKDYDDDINQLKTELNSVKSDYASKIDALKTELNSTVNSKVSELNAEIASLKTKVDAAASKAEIDAAKTEILGKVIAKEVYEKFVEDTNVDLDEIKADLAKAATKEELDAVQAALTTEIGEVIGQLDAMGLRVDKLETDYATLLAKHDTDVADLIASIAALEAELAPKITALETALDLLDGKVDDLDAELKGLLEDQLELINNNKKAIEDLAKELQDKYDELVKVDEDLQTQITTNTGDITTLKGQVKTIEDDIETINGRLDGLDKDVLALIKAYQTLAKSVSSLTFIPDFTSPDGTPQLPVHFLGEWYKPDAEVQNWDPNHNEDVLLTPYKGITYAKFHVSPSNATLNDFEVVGLLHKTSEVLFRSTEEPLLKAVVEDVTLKNGILTVPILIHADLYDNEDFSRYYGNGYQSMATTRARPDKDDERIDNRLWNPARNISVALQVKNKNAEEDDNTERLVVSTEYIRTQLTLMFARIELIRAGDEVGEWSNILPSHMANDIELTSYYKPSASINLWNGYNRSTGAFDRNYSINLNDSLRAIAEFNNVARILEDFGYDNIEDYFVYELIENPNEGVDQSMRYVDLTGSTGKISVKPGTSGPNQAAVGRTPVVLAKVVVDGKVYAAGYLKIVIVQEQDNSPIKFEFTLDDYKLGCDSKYNLTDIDLDKIDFDQIFNHGRVLLGKDEFFQAYRQNDMLVEVVSRPTGADGSEISFGWNIVQPTQGGNLKNYIEATVENTAPAGKYVVKTILVGTGILPNVEITWTINVTLPAISLTAYTPILNPATDNMIDVNPTIWEQQGAKTSTAYEALLNNAFMHNAGNYVFTPLPEDCDDALTPYFIFTAVPAGFVISDDGTKIYEAGHKGDSDYLAAVIEDFDGDGIFYVRLNEEVVHNQGSSWGNYPPLSDSAKKLLGTDKVMIQPRGYINGVPSNNIPLFNPFYVKFIEPLHLELPNNIAVYDQANNGNNMYVLDLYDPSVLVDWNGKLLDVTTEEGRDLIEHYEVAFDYESGNANEWVFVSGNLFQRPSGTIWINGAQGWGWYKYQSVDTESFGSPFNFALDKLKSNVKPDGTIDPNNVTYPIPAGIKDKISLDYIVGETTVVNGVATTTPAQLLIVWDNGATGAIKDEFKVAIPVSVAHKWGVLEGNVIFTVKVGSGPAPAPAP